MKLTEKQKLIMQGVLCPYCGKESEYVDSIVVYGKSYGMIYYCKPCDAYVGTHDDRKDDKGKYIALGRLAKPELRELKKEVHEVFDKLWTGRKMTRIEAYMWLSGILKIPLEYTHIGMFSIKTCKEAIRVCNQLYDDTYGMDNKVDDETV